MTERVYAIFMSQIFSSEVTSKLLVHWFAEF